MMPVTTAAWSKAWTVFARSDAGIVGWIPIKAWMFDMCMRLFCDWVALWLVSGLATGNHSSKRSYRLWKMITELNKRPGPWMGWKIHWKKVVNKSSLHSKTPWTVSLRRDSTLHRIYRYVLINLQTEFNTYPQGTSINIIKLRTEYKDFTAVALLFSHYKKNYFEILYTTWWKVTTSNFTRIS
jgi:hypothetical protein